MYLQFSQLHLEDIYFKPPFTDYIKEIITQNNLTSNTKADWPYFLVVVINMQNLVNSQDLALRLTLRLMYYLYFKILMKL